MNEVNTKPNGIMLFSKNLQFILEIPDESAGKIIKALVNYYLKGIEPEFEAGSTEKILYSNFKYDMESSFMKYFETCERRKAAGKKAAESRWKKVKLSEATSADDFKLNNEELSELKQFGMLDDENVAAKNDTKKTAGTSAPEPPQTKTSSDLSPVYVKTKNNIVMETKESAVKEISSDDNTARASGAANKYTKDRNISPEKIERDRNEYDKFTRNFLQDI